jgi:diguanylate cyclase (GGDEF)-like protein
MEVKEIPCGDVDYQALFERTRLASTPEACQACLPEITAALESATTPADRARMLMCRAQVSSYQSLDREVCEDAAAAMALFDLAGDTELAVDAASLAAAHASRLGNVSLSSELATRSVLGLDSVHDDRLRMEISNRLGVLCYYCLDYDRAVEQFELALAAAERIAEGEKVCRELYNLAEALLLACQQRRMSDVVSDDDQLERAEVTARRLLTEETAVMNHRIGSRRLLAEVLCDLGRVEDALQVLDEFQGDENAITSAAQDPELAWVEARCLRLAGRMEEALTAARGAVRIIEAQDDEHDLMLAIEELAACEEAAGDLQGALADGREVKKHMWQIHQRQTRRLVQQVWASADLERDRRSLQAQAAEATRSAEEDVLTGIGNRRLLERFLCEETVRRSEVGCIMADIDSFKVINDTFGHDVGDAVLRQVGLLLASKTRSGQQAIRYGGDEFVVALSGVDLASAYGFAERIRLAVSSLDWTTVAPGLHVTMSFGVACGPAADWQAALTAADSRLLAAKRWGRNAVVMASIGALAG